MLVKHANTHKYTRLKQQQQQQQQQNSLVIQTYAVKRFCVKNFGSPKRWVKFHQFRCGFCKNKFLEYLTMECNFVPLLIFGCMKNEYLLDILNLITADILSKVFIYLFFFF